jgi:hypothetical protein
MTAHRNNTNRMKIIGITTGLVGLGFTVALTLAGPAAADWDPAGPNANAPTMPDVFPALFAATSGTGTTTLTAQGTTDDNGFEAADVRGPLMVAKPQQ